jgi:hypothetical protein
MDAPDDENAVVEFDFTHSLGYQTLIRCIDLTRLQRASIGSGKSTGCSGHNIVESRRMWLKNCRRDLIMFRYRSVHAENHRRCLGGEPGAPNRAFDTFDSNLGTINDL